MEPCPGNGFDIRMIDLAAGWSDLGMWDAVWQTAEKDAAGNSIVGDVLLQDSRNTLVHATSRLVSVVGLEGVVVVETPDAVMVGDRAPKQRCSEDRPHAQKQPSRRAHVHRKVYRPWGCYDSIDGGSRFQVKRVMVNPDENPNRLGQTLCEPGHERLRVKARARIEMRFS
jgi:mannose-1-phosphate guanylyltransferase/mannose-6-phosphate isomerase